MPVTRCSGSAPGVTAWRYAVQETIALLDRGWGKPKEFVETPNLYVMGTDSPPIPETLEERLERRRTALAYLDDETPKH